MDIETYITKNIENGYIMKYEICKDSKFYLYKADDRSLLEITRNSSNNYTVKKYIIDSNELENYIYWNNF